MIKNYLQIIVGALIIMAFENQNATACTCDDNCRDCSSVDDYHVCVMDCGQPGTTKK